MPTVKIILPAFNEELALPHVLQAIENQTLTQPANLKVLIVNDGSTDKTGEVASKFNGKTIIEVIDIYPNKGLANAVRTGITSAIKDMNDNDVVITMDADNSHDPSLINQMKNAIHAGYDVVIASRFRKGAKVIGVPRYRRVLSIGASILFSLFIHLKGVRDYTCGYRAYRVGLLNNMLKKYGESFIEEQGFGCMAEILIKMKHFHPIIKEIPFILRYDLKPGISKMKVMRTISQTFNLVRRNLFS